jgi:2-polyprenyl-6-hydroxyphenyl methylase / 3-demethylubiquinone-9 3-methyltransferase
MGDSSVSTPVNTVDTAEIAKFEAMAAAWWDENGAFKPLHRFNPVRIAYVRDHLTRHFDRREAGKPLDGLTIVDIGCGGGLLAEPLARLGATVTGIDASPKNIGIARAHAAQQGVSVQYEATTAEALAATDARFDVVLTMEVVEHVADVVAFLQAAARLLKPNGLLFVATLNRTPASYVKAIIGAEYVLRWLPVGTHDWKKFCKPHEVAAPLSAYGLTIRQIDGMLYNPLTATWRVGKDVSVNYILVAHYAQG